MFVFVKQNAQLWEKFNRQILPNKCRHNHDLRRYQKKQSSAKIQRATF